jgi:hypothetical protein
MSLVTNKTESERIQKLKDKTLYANYLATQTKFQGGCNPIPPPIQSGSGSSKESSLLISIRMGATYTTVEERDVIVAKSSCPVTAAIAIVYTLITTDAVLYLDASNPLSYSGSGTTWRDLSTNGDNGTLVNSPTFITSPVKSFRFTNPTATPSGTNQRVNLTNNNIGDDFTISAWINTTGVGVGNTHLTCMWIVGAETSGTPPSSPGDFGFGIASNGKLLFGCSPNDFTNVLSTTAVNTGTWLNVVMTRTQSTNIVSYYINGVASGSGSAGAGSQSLNKITPTIAFPGGIEPGYPYNGSIGSVLFYTRVLSEEEAYINYQAEKSKYGL